MAVRYKDFSSVVIHSKKYNFETGIQLNCSIFECTLVAQISVV